MTAREIGTACRDGWPGGDSQLTEAWSRRFVHRLADGRLQQITVYAYAALVDPGASPDDPHAQRDVLEQTHTDTFRAGVTLDQALSPDWEHYLDDADVDYRWPVDYWPHTALRRDGRPRLDRLERAAQGHIRNLPQGWIDAMTDPEGDQ